jgi:hypothetical protein
MTCVFSLKGGCEQNSLPQSRLVLEYKGALVVVSTHDNTPLSQYDIPVFLVLEPQ